MSGAVIGGMRHLLSGSANQQTGPISREATEGHPGIQGTAFHLLLAQKSQKQAPLTTREDKGGEEKKGHRTRPKNAEQPSESGLVAATAPGSTVPLLPYRSPQGVEVQSSGRRDMPNVSKVGESQGTVGVRSKEGERAAISGRTVTGVAVRQQPGKNERPSGILQDGRGDVDGMTAPAPETGSAETASRESSSLSSRASKPGRAAERLEDFSSMSNSPGERTTKDGNVIAMEVVRSEPPTVTALASRGGAEVRRDRPSEDGLGPARPPHRSEGKTNAPMTGPTGTGGTVDPLPAQSAQESSPALTNVPIDQVGDRVGEWLTRHPWTPEDGVTLRVTVVPADLGPVQVVARMDADGQLHLQIHTANQDVQSLIQQQVGQLMGHLQQHHIPVQRIEVVNNPAVAGTIGQMSAFDGNGGSWQQGRRPPGEPSVQSVVPNPVAAGPASEDGQAEAAYSPMAAHRLPGSNTFEVVI